MNKREEISELNGWTKTENAVPQMDEPLTMYNDEKVIRENDHATVLAYRDDIGVYKAKFSKMGWQEIASFGSNATDRIPEYWKPLPIKTKDSIKPLSEDKRDHHYFH